MPNIYRLEAFDWPWDETDKDANFTSSFFQNWRCTAARHPSMPRH